MFDHYDEVQTDIKKFPCVFLLLLIFLISTGLKVAKYFQNFNTKSCLTATKETFLIFALGISTRDSPNCLFTD